MSLTVVVVEGTLKPDGTLELDQKPSLAPGRVRVVLQAAAESSAAQEGWWPYLQRLRAEREAAGYHFMNEAEMQAHLAWIREDEDRIERIHHEIDLEKRKTGQP
jgi:hypothetical protein